jgi:DnaJ homolog subfamily A member 2
MVHDTILYDRLNVKSDVTDKEIKKAYHKLSMKWHPDKNSSDEATAKFQEISEAYNILSNSEKRKMYDNVGINILKNENAMPDIDPTEIFKHFMGSMGGMGGGFPFGGNAFGGNAFGGNAFGGNPFGGNRFGGNPFDNNDNEKEAENCTVNITVTLEQLYNQEEITIKYDQKNYCIKCNGTGNRNGRESTCSTCNGSGKKVIIRQLGNMMQQMIRTCSDCSGTGENINNNDLCIDCNGKKYKIKNKTVEIRLNNNLNNNHQVKIQNKGHNFKKYRTDLIIIIMIKNHKIFIKENNDLHMNMDIKLYQLMFGLNKSIKHLDNRLLFLNINKFNFDSFNDKFVYLVKNEGMTSNSNLIIHFNIVKCNINKLEENEKTILKKILVKCDIDEFKEEINILKNKNKLIKTNIEKCDLESYTQNESYSNNNSQYENNDDEQPQCVQQ